MYLQTVNPHLLPSQHSWSSSAADHRVHLHLSLPSITSLTAAVRLNLIMDGKRTSRVSLSECTERRSSTQSWRRAGERVWDDLAAAVSALNICVLLSMRTTTCNTFTQSKTFYISCCQHSISCQILFHVYNYMLIFDIASLLLWCSELVSRRLLVRSLQSSPSVCPSATQKVILVKFVLLVLWFMTLFDDAFEASETRV